MMKILTKLPALLVIGAIWFLSSQSTLPHPKGVFGIDKVQHLIAYAVLAGTSGLWASPKQWNTRPLLILLFIIGIASMYGVIDEIHQSFVPGRDSSVWDWLADTFGAVVGTVPVMLISRRVGRLNEARTAEKAL